MAAAIIATPAAPPTLTPAIAPVESFSPPLKETGVCVTVQLGVELVLVLVVLPEAGAVALARAREDAIEEPSALKQFERLPGATVTNGLNEVFVVVAE